MDQKKPEMIFFLQNKKPKQTKKFTLIRVHNNKLLNFNCDVAKFFVLFHACKENFFPKKLFQL